MKNMHAGTSAGGGETIRTRYRRIVSRIPHPGSQHVIDELAKIEPRSMAGFSPVVWEKAEGFQVWDAYGNKWIDFTSAILVANAGHSHPTIAKGIREQLDRRLWHHYCNPSELRLRTIAGIAEILPPYLSKIFLLTTGSEAVECAIKLMRIHGRRIAPEKFHILSFSSSFHGRTMGSQSAGGFRDQQSWMGRKPPGFHHIPFPECARCPWGRDRYEKCGRECLERGLDRIRKECKDFKLFAGVITETFQGPTVAFLPADFARALREWANAQSALLVFDDIQAGFGRTGRWFGFEHYGVEADLVCMGKGMTSSLPMAAVAGRAAIMDLPAHGEMSSTHTGNPLCSAAAIANIKAIREGKLVENAAALGKEVSRALRHLQNRFPDRVRHFNGKGLAWAIYLFKVGSKQMDIDLARRVTERCIGKGLLLFQTNRGTLKIAPPLCIEKEALREGLAVIEESIVECTADGSG